MRALLVEDEILLRQQLADSLRSAGYTVDEAPDGEEALYLGREYPYDVAVMDLGLPKIDGIQVIKTLRAEERHFPILILTARGHWQERVARSRGRRRRLSGEAFPYRGAAGAAECSGTPLRRVLVPYYQSGPH